MNKEEILDNIFKDENVNGFILSDERYKELKDYITNLQQENKRLNNIINETKDYITKISSEPNVFGHYAIDDNCKNWLLSILNKSKELRSGNNG